MICVDSSVAIAGFASWHERHADAAAVIHGKVAMPSHAIFETCSVLTRLPPPHRAYLLMDAAVVSL